MKVYINGRIVLLNKANISILDRGFLYGDGAFESLRTYGGKPFLLDQHLKRLFQTLKLLKILPQSNLSTVKTAVYKTLAANNFKESYIKIIISRGMASSHGLNPSNVRGSPTVIITVEKLKPYPESVYRKGWKAVISSIPKSNTPSARIKSLCYLDNLLASAEAKRKHANEAFLLDDKGNLAEGTVSNIFTVKNNVIYTPSLQSPILAGVTRSLVIRLARHDGIRVAEKDLSSVKLFNADECFITFSGGGIIPVTKVNNRKIGKGRCGSLTKLLIKLYDAETKKI